MRKFRAAASLPPRLLCEEVSRRIRNKISASWRRRADKVGGTFSAAGFPVGQGLSWHLENADFDLSEHERETAALLCAHYLAHRFDLLGSGWVEVGYGSVCRGVEGKRYDVGRPVCVDPQGKWLDDRVVASNREESRRIWQRIEPGYTPIDWQLDVKSGFRWSATTWYRDIVVGHPPGADVKVPWELARMQHLPHLALAYHLACKGVSGFDEPDVYWRECRNQTLDFIATNPPRYGANWACTMDVAIRAANWLVAVDLFRAAGAPIDPEFLEIYSRSIFQHGTHIVNNLEWRPKYRNNHYLADIAGLLFVAAYLPQSVNIDAWMAFAVQELIDEVAYQFGEDGANFEASTCYHRLSAEMAVWGAALAIRLAATRRQSLLAYDRRAIKGRPSLRRAPIPFHAVSSDLPKTPIPAWYFERLERMVEFTIASTKPDGHIVQSGDNDSGRFIKLGIAGATTSVAEAKRQYVTLADYDALPESAAYWQEDHLDHASLATLANGLFRRDGFAKFADGHGIEARLIESLSGNLVVPSYRRNLSVSRAEDCCIGDEAEWREAERKICDAAVGARVFNFVGANDGLRRELETQAYKDFGLYLFRSPALFMSVRCGSLGQNGRGGHAHVDQLSIELCLDGVERIVDPGTYLYTASPERRNQYRSAKSHFVPQPVGLAPERLNLGLFALSNAIAARCVYFGARGFIGNLRKGNMSLWRRIEILDDRVQITDYCESRGGQAMRNVVWQNPTPTLFSPGYGIQECRTAPIVD